MNSGNASYVDFMKAEIMSRKARNPGYSERAFARAAGLSPGFMKLVFQRKKNLSLRRAGEVASRLSWNELRRKSFLESVRSGKTGAPASAGIRAVSIDDFIEISDWYHFA